jgi:hypothetical protein
MCSICHLHTSSSLPLGPGTGPVDPHSDRVHSVSWRTGPLAWAALPGLSRTVSSATISTLSARRSPLKGCPDPGQFSFRVTPFISHPKCSLFFSQSSHGPRDLGRGELLPGFQRSGEVRRTFPRLSGGPRGGRGANREKYWRDFFVPWGFPTPKNYGPPQRHSIVLIPPRN